MDVLLVDDDEPLRSGLAELVRRAGHRVVDVGDGVAALERIAAVDVMVTDLRMPRLDGIELVRQARLRRPDVEVIVMTAYGSVPTAVEAMRLGARAYLTKPFEPDELLLHLREVEKVARLRAQASSGRGQLVGSSEIMRRVYADIDLAATSPAPVLITGETGTGKELAARAVHDASRRSRGPFIAVNCGALPRDLVESELFGHLAGAFTGAAGRRKGRFALAEGGSLFLDEIDSLPVDLQPKLLRVLETGDIWPLGAEKSERVDVRIIAATNARIDALVADGRFREDLFYRLNVLHIVLPALRERPEDIPQIVRALATRAAARDPDERWTISAAALSQLVAQPWPGNVRELVNAVERARARARAANPGDRAQGGAIEIQHLDAAQIAANTLPFKQGKERAADDWAKRAIRVALETSDGNVSQAARSLRMSRTALLRLIARYRMR